MTRETDVLQLTNTLSSDHLQHALDLLATSKRHHDPSKWRPSDDEEQLWPDKTSHLYALSSMMHAFAALEGHVNRIAYAILREHQFPYFVAPENRTFEFKELISKWDGNLSLEKKMQFLLDQQHATYPGYLIPNLRELSNLRNWIVHGNVYRTALLVERSADKPNSGTVWLRANDEEWAPRFPSYKFPMPDRLSYPDARKFFIGIVETMSYLADAYKWTPFVIVGQPGVFKVIKLSVESDAGSQVSAYLDEV